jgi:chromatin segregation and condensation protein Rec8/ScpA/Scc1 (kleisin family)
LFQLVAAFRGLFQGLDSPSLFSISADEYTVTERVEFLRSQLRDGSPIPFNNLFAKGDPRGKLIATLLALLELIRSSEARAFQEGMGGEITVFPVEVVEQIQ